MSEQVGRVVGFGVEKGTGPFPHLVERLMPAVYRRCGVPCGLARNDLIAWAGDRAVALRRRMCLVFGPGDCVYLALDGCWQVSADIPRGGLAVCEASDAAGGPDEF